MQFVSLLSSSGPGSLLIRGQLKFSLRLSYFAIAIVSHFVTLILVSVKLHVRKRAADNLVCGHILYIFPILVMPANGITNLEDINYLVAIKLEKKTFPKYVTR